MENLRESCKIQHELIRSITCKVKIGSQYDRYNLPRGNGDERRRNSKIQCIWVSILSFSFFFSFFLSTAVGIFIIKLYVDVPTKNAKGRKYANILNTLFSEVFKYHLAS